MQKIILEQRKKGIPNTLYERAIEIGESIAMSIDQAVEMKKSTWKREVKTKLKKKIQQRLTDDLKEKTIARTIQKDKWLMKENIKNGNTDEIKDILKIRLHMWELRKNYPKKWHRYNMPNLQKQRRYNRACAWLGSRTWERKAHYWK